MAIGQGRSELGQIFFGNPEQQGQMSKYSSGNQGQFNDLISQILGRFGGQGGQGGIGSGTGPFSFAPIAEAAQNRFESRTMPSIMERLSSMGGGGGLSNASTNVPAQARADLQLGLASQESQFNQNQIGDLLKLLGLGQQDPFYNKRQPGLFETTWMQGSELAGKALPLMMG